MRIYDIEFDIERDERFWKAVRDVFASRPLPEPTYCDGCKRFSRGIVCPYCNDHESSSNGDSNNGN